ncbi:MFS transporter [Nonomuraea salmonea]|uniref:MFS transporter n=1 Tax=Nonomuraea salmonea TaxID=46181 RepID=UPI002FE7C8ED
MTEAGGTRARQDGGLRELLGANRDYRRLLSAGLISQTGDWVISTGLAYHVYVLTGSTLSSAVMLLSARLPDVLLGSVAGVLADRWDRRRLLVVADVLLGLGLLPLLAVREPGQVWIVYAVALWTGVLSTVLFPAQKALVPQIVPGSQLVRANALTGQSGQAARLLGGAGRWGGGRGGRSWCGRGDRDGRVPGLGAAAGRAATARPRGRGGAGGGGRAVAGGAAAGADESRGAAAAGVHDDHRAG